MTCDRGGVQAAAVAVFPRSQGVERHRDGQPTPQDRPPPLTRRFGMVKLRY
jgi:hypothetical protein